MDTNLYLIALIPGEGIRNQVRQLKLEMSERFNASHALKAPAHITLQMPFRRKNDHEQLIIEELRHFSKTVQPFDIKIDGFDAFPPRVLYLNIQDHIPIKELHERLNRTLKTKLHFSEKECNDTIHPHMTIATRDLSKKMFHKAWPEFQERNFDASFTADHLHLLKHNGKHWELFEEFSFDGEE